MYFFNSALAGCSLHTCSDAQSFFEYYKLLDCECFDVSVLIYKSAGRPPSSATAPPKGLGMKLGKSQRANQFLESLKAEGEVILEDVRPSAGPAKAAVVPLTDPVTLIVEEKLNVTLKRDGGVSNFDVQGTLSLQILNQDDGLIQVQVRTIKSN